MARMGLTLKSTVAGKGKYAEKDGPQPGEVESRDPLATLDTLLASPPPPPTQKNQKFQGCKNEKVAKTKTINSQDSQVVTHLSTN